VPAFNTTRKIRETSINWPQQLPNPINNHRKHGLSALLPPRLAIEYGDATEKVLALNRHCKCAIVAEIAGCSLGSEGTSLMVTTYRLKQGHRPDISEARHEMSFCAVSAGPTTRLSDQFRALSYTTTSPEQLFLSILRRISLVILRR